VRLYSETIPLENGLLQELISKSISTEQRSDCMRFLDLSRVEIESRRDSVKRRSVNRLEDRSIRGSIPLTDLSSSLALFRNRNPGRKITRNSLPFDVFIRFNHLLLYSINMEHVSTETSITILSPPSNQRHYKNGQYMRFLKGVFCASSCQSPNVSHAIHYICISDI